MKNLSFLITVLVFFQITAFSQSCLPYGITFSTQAQIDSFQINYPGCSEIEGGVFIGVNTGHCYIKNLNGLNVLTYIGGDLVIRNNDSLTSLTGLEGLTSIRGALSIGVYLAVGNPALTSLTGLDNLTSIGGDLNIFCNDALTSLTGLEGLNSIGGDLWIVRNNALTSITGLEGLSSIGGGLEIGSYMFGGNDALTSLTGLDNVTTIGGDLVIKNNDSLASLTGLDNIEASSIDNLYIAGNSSLSTCEVQSICDYLSSPAGTVDIHNNASGCNNSPEVANACGVTLPCLPFGPYYFIAQADIDNFQSNYPGCTQLEGNVYISGNDIVNLNGLSVVISIGGDLWIEDNDSLTSLTGLEGLTSIGGGLLIGECWYGDGNPALTSLTGLSNLTTIVGNLEICYNDSLTSLTGLEGLNSIGGDLLIGGYEWGGK
jgi:hypothetical protein